MLETPDEFQLLARRAALKRVCLALRSRGMLASDAFRKMDRASRGAISAAEFGAGVQWLGLSLSKAQARSGVCSAAGWAVIQRQPRIQRLHDTCTMGRVKRWHARWLVFVAIREPDRLRYARVRAWRCRLQTSSGSSTWTAATA